MKMFRTPNLKNRKNKKAATVIAHWDRDWVNYFVVDPKTASVRANYIGAISRATSSEPLPILAEHLKKQGIAVDRLMVLLSRPELDQLALDLPPAEVSELPGLVAMEVEQRLGDSDEPAIVDYCIAATNESQPVGARHLIAFALSKKEFVRLESQSEEAGFKLVAIGSRHLAPLAILRKRHAPDRLLSVSVHVYSGEVELAICQGAEPILLRSIRVNSDDPNRIAEQIWMETQRCMALLPSELADVQPSWFVFTTCELAWKIIPAIEDQGGVSIQPIDPLLGWNQDAEVANDGSQPTSAANVGAGWDILEDSLPINLLQPKRPPKQPNPTYRWITLAAAMLVPIAAGIYFLLGDIENLKSEALKAESDLADAEKLVAKYQEKADQVLAVEDWINDQVDWLSELQSVSERLPNGQAITVRRLSAASLDKQASIDLDLQVADQSVVSTVEGRFRSARYNIVSKQVSQNAEATEYPWQFETRITFKPEPISYKAYGPPKQPDPTKADTPPKEGDSEVKR